MIWAVQEPADNNNSHINNSVNNNGDHYSRVAQFPAVEYDWRELPQVSFLSRQRRVCRDKTRLLSQLKYACRDKTFVATNTCLSPHIRDNFFFIYFCRDKRRVCRDKTFVATKIILVATPANDRKRAIVDRTNIGTVSKATLGKLLRQAGVHSYGLFPAHGYHELN